MEYCLCYPQKRNGEAKVSRTEEQLQSKRNAFAALLKDNMEYEQNIEDYKTKMSERYNVEVKPCNILIRFFLLSM